MLFERASGCLGIVALIGAVWLASKRRRAVSWQQVGLGLGLQVLLAVLLFWVPGVQEAFAGFSSALQWFVGFADRGAEKVLGNLAGGSFPVEIDGRKAGLASLGVVLILKILPTIVFVSSAMSVLYHLGILQWVVTGMAVAVRWVLRVSGAEALAATANVFMGMTEAPLLVRPYLPAMTESELLAVMVGGLATISGSMMAVYSSLFDVEFSFLLGASVLSAPAALYLTKVYLPETGAPLTLGEVKVRFQRDTVNVVDAAASGASVGLQLALNVGAMLLAFAAGLAFIDAVLGWAGGFILPPGQVLSLGRILGWLFLPLAWLIGVPAADCAAVGQLLGTKLALNEYFAYQTLAGLELSARARGIAAFALCGFANFGSIAILLGGLGGLVPERRGELARLGVPAMLIAAAANCISAAIAGVVLRF